MTAAEWDACLDPTPMFECLWAGGQLSRRQAALFGAAVCRRIWPLLTDARSRRAVETTERCADGLTTVEKVQAVVDDAWRAPKNYEDSAAWAAAYVGTGHIVPAEKAAWVTAQSAAGSSSDWLGRM